MKIFKEMAVKIAVLCMLCVLSLGAAAAGDRPKVMLMIAEQNIGDQVLVYWWSRFGAAAGTVTPYAATLSSVTGVERQTDIKNERFDLAVGETALKGAFLKENFDVVDIASVTDKIRASEAYQLADLTKTATLEIAKDVGADVVVIGKVIARRGPTDTGSKVGTYMADMTATAFQVKDGLVLASGRTNDVARHISEITGGSQAIENASKKLATEMIAQIHKKIGP